MNREAGNRRPALPGAEVTGGEPFFAAAAAVLILALALIAALLWENMKARDHALSEARLTTHHEATMVAEFGSRTIELADLVLIHLIDALNGSNAIARGDGETARAVLQASRGRFPPLQFLAVHGADGRLLAGFGNAPPDISGMRFFADHSRGSMEYTIGVAVADEPSGGVRLSRRLSDVRGAFTGIVSAALAPMAFETHLDLDVSRRVDAMAFTSRSGGLVARWPRPVPGAPLTEGAPPAFDTPGSPAGAGTGIRVVETDTMIAASAPLRNAPMIAVVSVSHERVLAKWRTDAWRVHAGIVAIVAVIGVLGVYASFRQARRRATLEAAIRLRDRVVFDSVEGIVILRVGDVEPAIIFANPAFERISGHAAREVMGHGPRFLYRDDPDQPGVAAFRRALRERTGARFELRATRKDGSRFWAEVSVAPLGDDDGDAAHLVVMIGDVSARRETEDVVRRREAILSAIVFATEALLRAEDWTEALAGVVNRLGPASGARWLALYRLDRDANGSGILESRARWLGDAAAVGTPPPPSTLRGMAVDGSPLAQCLDDPRAVTVDSPRDIARILPERMDSARLLAVPVTAGGTAWGVLILEPGPARGPDDTEIAALCAAADVLGAAIQQAALRERSLRDEARFVLAAEAGRVGIWEWVPATGALHMSPNLKTILGHSEATLPPRMDAWSRLFHPDDHHLFQSAMDAHLRGEAPAIACEHRMIARDGGVIWFLVRGVAERDSQGALRRVVGSCLDITDRKRTERALVESENRLAEAQRIARLGRWERNLTNGTLWWSDEVYAIFGIPEGTPITQETFARAVHPDDRERILSTTNRALRSRNVLNDDEFRIVRADGRVRHVATRLGVKRDETGRPIHLTGTIQDVTERKEAETALLRAKIQAEQANIAKSNFLAHMSHELRTPLNSVIGFSDMMMGEILGPLGDAKYREYARDINAAGQHLLEVINDILDVSRIEAGVADMNETEVDLREIVDACALIVRERMVDAGLHFVSDIRPDHPRLRGDARRLRQILLNLLSNAIKFTEPGGTVGVRIQPTEDGGFQITVSDDGIGIAPADIPLVMEPFGQARNPLTRRKQGTGLGLTITRALAELHQATMSLESAPGKGTVVTIQFPAARAARPAATESASA